jgi:hypothetical protein
MFDIIKTTGWIAAKRSRGGRSRAQYHGLHGRIYVFSGSQNVQ